MQEKQPFVPEETQQNIGLTIRNLNKSFGKKHIIHDFSLEVKRGEVFGLLGPNGAGKTTIMKMVMGFLHPDTGEISITGVPVKKHYEKAMAHIGGIVENPEMYGYLSAWDNLQMYARLHPGVTKARMQQVVHQLRLENRIKDKVKKYSLGMKQRLGLAQAMLHDPDVLMLDEPTNGLDPAGIHELRGILKDLAHKEGKSIVVSSHLLGEMQQICDRVAIVQEGKLIGIHAVREEKDNIPVWMDVKPLELALQSLRVHYPDAKVEEEGILLSVPKQEVPRVVQQLVQDQCSLYELKYKESSLESMFLEITGGGQTIA